MSRIMIIEDDVMMAECLQYAAQKALTTSNNDDKVEHHISHYSNAISAMAVLNQTLPDLILLDVLLDGPDGFSFLNELISYSDASKIPVIIISSLDLQQQNLTHYGVVAIFQKSTVLPEQITATIKEYISHAQ